MCRFRYRAFYRPLSPKDESVQSLMIPYVFDMHAIVKLELGKNRIIFASS